MLKIFAKQCNLLLTRVLPFLRWWPMVNRQTLRADFIAGLTGAVIVLPQGVAFALIAGLPPVYGLYSAMVPPIIAALFGSSRHLISGPTTAISIVVFATVSQFAEPGSPEYIQLALTLTFLAGAYQFGLGLARMGVLVNFVSHSVVVGFTAGAAILIATSQITHFFGVHIPPGESFLHTWQDLFAQIHDINVYATAVALLTLVVSVGIMLFRPRWPGLLAAMVIGSILALIIGAEAHQIKLVGELPRSLPPLSLPDFSLGALRKLGSGALAIAMLGLVEAVSIARSVALKSGQRIDGNQEFVGQGLANIIGSFSSSYASSGSFTRSGINYAAGAVTPMAAIFAAVTLALIVVLIAPWAGYLPISAMAGILLVVAWRLIDFHHIRTIIETSRSETIILATTFFATLFIELVFAIYVGIILSLIFYLMRTSRPRVVSLVPDTNSSRRQMVVDNKLPECPQMKIVRIDGSLFFGAIDYVQRNLRSLSEQAPEQKHLLIIGTGINFIDVAGAEMIVQESERRKRNGGGLYVVKVNEYVCNILKRGGYLQRFGAENVFVSKADAIGAIFEELDHDRCARCDKRIFRECAQIPPLNADGKNEPL
ncbi:MAG TPA: SulP family inorganic anion transporter [Acidiferrobacteraceae bacterium]|nr:SulP family inorganic anion transporter [Acidiferrobacteraceae bacterium]HEX20219.1 SulP family inorganic anion transporter [Acidiferrobacteraceae bacterium]